MARNDEQLVAYVDISEDYGRERRVTMGVCVIRSPDFGGTMLVEHTSTLHTDSPDKLAERLIEIEKETSCNMFVFDAPSSWIAAIRHYLPHLFHRSRRFYRITPL